MNEDVPKRELGSEEHPDDDAGLYVISVAAELSGLHPQTLRQMQLNLSRKKLPAMMCVQSFLLRRAHERRSTKARTIK